jgi:MarR family transcriptional regulator, lower aerobic nicotinate degradation pathway regulator
VKFDVDQLQRAAAKRDSALASKANTANFYTNKEFSNSNHQTKKVLCMKTPSKARSDHTYRLDDQIGFILRLAFQFHTAIFTARMIDDLTPTQFAALTKVHEMGECSQSDLVRLIGLDSATINGVIGRMIAREYLTVTEDPNDRRRQFVSLTRQGRAVVEQAQIISSEISEETLSSLSATEQSRLIQLLRKMLEPSRAHQRWTQSKKTASRRLVKGKLV